MQTIFFVRRIDCEILSLMLLLTAGRQKLEQKHSEMCWNLINSSVSIFVQTDRAMRSFEKNKNLVIRSDGVASFQQYKHPASFQFRLAIRPSDGYCRFDRKTIRSDAVEYTHTGHSVIAIIHLSSLAVSPKWL